MNGYMGKVLFVDLTERTYEEKVLDEQIYREYIGGFGLGARILYEYLKPKSDPLGPDNILGFVCGPFVGTRYHGAGRVSVVAKSPQWGGWVDSSCGGNLGPKVRSTGYDGVFITGASDRPLTLLVSDAGVQFLDAGHLWGRDALETERLLKAEHGRKVAVATIGQAGERLSRISGIVHDRGRLAARCGVGAVMGSKHLKAVVFSGTQKVPVADQAVYEAVIKRMQADAEIGAFGGDIFGEIGTTIVFAGNVSIQDAPVQNWKGMSHRLYPPEKADKLASAAYMPYRKRAYACAQCHIHCGAILEYEDADGNKFETHRPEYETIAGFGSNCLIDDLDTVIMANEACNRYGFDTISASATIAFAMECYEKGFITDADTGGLSLAWGNKDAVLPLLEAMVKREGIGEIFADGTKSPLTSWVGAPRPLRSTSLGSRSATMILVAGPGSGTGMHSTPRSPITARESWGSSSTASPRRAGSWRGTTSTTLARLNTTTKIRVDRWPCSAIGRHSGTAWGCACSPTTATGAIPSWTVFERSPAGAISISTKPFARASGSLH